MLNKTLIAAIAMLTMAGSAFAMSLPGKRPGGTAPGIIPVHDQPNQQASPGQGTMMDRDWMDWDDMPMMRGQMPMMGSDMMVGQHVEGRIAFLKAELGITPAQEAQWNPFADALRANGQAMADMHQRMMGGGMPATLPQRLEWREQMMTSHLEALRTIKVATGPLYGALSNEQRRIADNLIMGMGSM